MHVASLQTLQRSEKENEKTLRNERAKSLKRYKGVGTGHLLIKSPRKPGGFPVGEAFNVNLKKDVIKGRVFVLCLLAKAFWMKVCGLELIGEAV